MENENEKCYKFDYGILSLKELQQFDSHGEWLHYLCNKCLELIKNQAIKRTYVDCDLKDAFPDLHKYGQEFLEKNLIPGESPLDTAIESFLRKQILEMVRDVKSMQNYEELSKILNSKNIMVICEFNQPILKENAEGLPVYKVDLISLSAMVFRTPRFLQNELAMLKKFLISILCEKALAE